jgi:DNA-binding transcriptional MerR regulator
MENGKEKLFIVGELARKANVTIRTLQYYDKCGLLSAQVSEGGRRLYGQKDMNISEGTVFKS